jgi:hypothetical protein
LGGDLPLQLTALLLLIEAAAQGGLRLEGLGLQQMQIAAGLSEAEPLAIGAEAV